MCYKHSHRGWGRSSHAHWKRNFHQQMNRPPADISEKEDHFELLLFAPGLDKSNLTIRVKNDELIIAYQKSKEQDEIVTDFEEEAFTHPSFRRTFRLNKKVLIEDISAGYTDGVVKVTLPKNPETNHPIFQVEID